VVDFGPGDALPALELDLEEVTERAAVGING
jgi:hypothetical protein